MDEADYWILAIISSEWYWAPSNVLLLPSELICHLAFIVKRNFFRKCFNIRGGCSEGNVRRKLLKYTKLTGSWFLLNNSDWKGLFEKDAVNQHLMQEGQEQVSKINYHQLDKRGREGGESLLLWIFWINFRFIMVLMESMVSGHKYNAIRERLGDKLEVIRFDPYSEFSQLVLFQGNGWFQVNFTPFLHYSTKGLCLPGTEKDSQPIKCGTTWGKRLLLCHSTPQMLR